MRSGLPRLAGGVLDDVSRLRNLAATEDLIHQPDQLDAVKYRFVTAVEGCVGIAHDVRASEGWTVPESNAAALRGLAAHGVVDGTQLDALEGFVRELLGWIGARSTDATGRA